MSATLFWRMRKQTGTRDNRPYLLPAHPASPSRKTRERLAAQHDSTMPLSIGPPSCRLPCHMVGNTLEFFSFLMRPVLFTPASPASLTSPLESLFFCNWNVALRPVCHEHTSALSAESSAEVVASPVARQRRGSKFEFVYMAWVVSLPV